MDKIFNFSIAFLIFLIAFSFPALAQNPFLDMIQSFRISGIFDIFLFILFFVVFYAILMKAKVLGNNAGVNGVVALIIAFFLSLYSTFTGFSLIEPMSRLLTQASVIGLMFVAALVIASVFYPDLPKMLAEHIKGPTILYVLIPLALALLITSRTIWVFWAGYKATPGPGSDVMLLVVGLLIFGVILIIAGIIGGGGKK
ncbi:MAG: hypothetical protein QXL86_02240 [Candidatus Aenigmatarchaeota archaeon]